MDEFLNYLLQIYSQKRHKTNKYKKVPTFLILDFFKIPNSSLRNGT